MKSTEGKRPSRVESGFSAGSETGLKSLPNNRVQQPRVGIYSGTFDPVHAGHIAFALQAASETQLDKVYIVPERQPRGKEQVTHFVHRVAMVRRACRPFGRLGVLELEDKTFSVVRTLPRLEKRFPDTRLVFLCGSDVLRNMRHWEFLETFLTNVELCVGLRGQETPQELQAIVSKLPTQPVRVWFVKSHAAQVSSSQIREALRKHTGVRGLLASVRAYAAREWLYLN